MNSLNSLISGMACMGFAVAAAMFIRFWQRSHERLFLFFSGAFFALMLERLLREVPGVRSDQPAIYLVRLAAFAFLLVAIVDKNRRG
jgi:hypothetical protein